MLSPEGIVKVTLTFDQKVDHSRLLIVISSGFVLNCDEDELKSITIDRIKEPNLHANSHLQKDVEKAVRNVIYTETRRRPLVLVSVNELE